MCNIRMATLEDLPSIMEMGEKFYAESPYSQIKPFNYDGMAVYAKSLIEDHYMLLATKDEEPVGMAASYMTPLPINPDIYIATEVVFWVDPEYRGTSIAIRLMLALEDAVDTEAPDAKFMSSLSTSPPVTHKLYKKLGYDVVETAYMKGA
jgi:ribosomal protein S18 acetylase RimI-like enzyme